MAAQEPFAVTLEPNLLEFWDDESTASALRALAMRLHSTDISLRETAAALEQFGVTRLRQAVWQWVHRTAEMAPDPPSEKPSGVAIDETAVKTGTSNLAIRRNRCQAKLLLGAVVSERRGTDPDAAFLGRLAEKHDFSETTFLVDSMGDLTALTQCDLRRHLL